MMSYLTALSRYQQTSKKQATTGDRRQEQKWAC
jgi:hypothetical protein